MLKKTFASFSFALLTALSGLSMAADTPLAPPPAPVPAVTASAAVAVPVNINTADVTTLARELYGVGETKARAIVDYRTSKGAFTSVDQLLEVQGIGTGILEKNRSRLTVN